MKIIDKKSFWPIVCVIYTCLSLGKIILELVLQGVFGNEQMNFLTMFLLAFLGTFVLSQHYRLEKYPLGVVMLGQYVVLIAAVMLFIRIEGAFVELHEDAYHDMFWSFTIPYVIAALVYYISLYIEIKRTNQLLQDMKKRE